MIALKDIQKHFVMASGRLDVIRGIDLEIGRGEFVSIMGTSGSGKSTLLNIIGCLDVPSSGSYTLMGHDVASMSDAALSALRNHSIGFVFQSFNLIARNTARRNVEKPLIYQGANARTRFARATALLAHVGLSDRADHRPSQLSGGQQQRVAIARALICNPDLLIADEPTGNLDSETTRDIMRLLRAICDEGRTVVMVTHDRSLAEQSDRMVELADGRRVR